MGVFGRDDASDLVVDDLGVSTSGSAGGEIFDRVGGSSESIDASRGNLEGPASDEGGGEGEGIAHVSFSFCFGSCRQVLPACILLVRAAGALPDFSALPPHFDAVNRDADADIPKVDM